MMHGKLLKLEDLVSWVNNGTLELPDVQRGFVWKPWQIEDLWDSILRGFPAGSVIVDEKSNNQLQLLDGQQRTTSIALAFAELDATRTKTKILNSSVENIRIFIDMKKPNVEETGRHYIFRVITRSHPWGYQLFDNKKILNSVKRSEAMCFWNSSENYFDEPIDKFYPWDSYAPLPLNIFINAALKKVDTKTLMDMLFKWVNKIKPVEASIKSDMISHWLSYLYLQNEWSREETYTIEEIYDTIKHEIDNYLIPMLPLDLDQSTKDISDNKGDSKITDRIEEDKDVMTLKKDDIEEVFIRLNTQGTPLGGEELNYSILKSKLAAFNMDMQEEIEKACNNIMKPARFITLVFRLYENCEKNGVASIDMSPNPKKFQRLMEKEAKKFAGFINKILQNGLLDRITIFLKYGQTEIDKYKPDLTDYRLPYPLFIKIADKAPEVMFLLMYRVYKILDSFEYDTPVHRRMIGIVLLLMWHGKGIPILQKAWRAAKILPKEKMWSNMIINLVSSEDLLQPIPKNNEFLSTIKEPNGNTDIWKVIGGKNYALFYKNVMRNKDILLYAQREFIASSGFFTDKLFGLEDTNTPFDYDHISPQNYVRGKKRYAPPKPLKDIYNEPCNLRVWPYTLNRADHDDVPSVKFAIDEKTEEKQSFLREILENKITSLSSTAINLFLLHSSFCEKSWLKFTSDWIQGNKSIKKDNWRNVYDLLWKRWKNLYDVLNEEILISKLATTRGSEISWKDIVNNNSWERFKSSYDTNWYQLHLDNNLYFYLSISDENEEEIEFGVYGKPELFSNYKSNREKYKFTEDVSPEKGKDQFYIYSNEVLSCPYIEGYRELYKIIKKWLTGLKYNDIGAKAIKKIEKALSGDIII
jgi:hypothetical protein